MLCRTLIEAKSGFLRYPISVPSNSNAISTFTKHTPEAPKEDKMRNNNNNKPIVTYKQNKSTHNCNTALERSAGKLLGSLNQGCVCSYSQTKANFWFSYDSFRRRLAVICKLVRSCLLAQQRWRAMRIKKCMLFRNKKQQKKIFTVSILCIRFPLKLIISVWLHLILRLVNENNGFSLIWGHIRRVYTNRSEDVK